MNKTVVDYMVLIEQVLRVSETGSIRISVWDDAKNEHRTYDKFNSFYPALMYVNKLIDSTPSTEMITLWKIDFASSEIVFVINASWASGRV